MVDATQVDWKAIDSRPEFQELHRKKMGFLWGLMVFSMVYYFLLPIGAAYFPELYQIKVWGPVNVGILFALSEFVVAWALAYYLRQARERRCSIRWPRRSSPKPRRPWEARNERASPDTRRWRLRAGGDFHSRAGPGRCPRAVPLAHLRRVRRDHHGDDVRHLRRREARQDRVRLLRRGRRRVRVCRTAGRSPATTCRRRRSSASRA